MVPTFYIVYTGVRADRDGDDARHVGTRAGRWPRGENPIFKSFMSDCRRGHRFRYNAVHRRKATVTVGGEGKCSGSFPEFLIDKSNINNFGSPLPSPHPLEIILALCIMHKYIRAIYYYDYCVCARSRP